MSTLKIRPSVKYFSQLMEKTLRKHDKTKGGQENWRKDSVKDLFDRVS